MKREIMRWAVLAATVVGSGAMGAGCVTRPVEHQDPTTKVNFTTVVRNQAIDKLDLLFMIDNSASMGDKQGLLAQAVPDMINRLVAPLCVNSDLSPNGETFSPTGGCAKGKAEFPPVHDMHIGIVTSSLGGRGGDQCDPGDKSMGNGGLPAHNDDRGELIIRGGPTESSVVDAQATGGGGNFLAWYPAIVANMGPGKTPPDVVALGPNPGTANTPGTLVGDFTTMISGVHEHGCGWEATNEAWYRFLVQPDPFDHISKNGNTAQLVGFDDILLKQRADFLRPDSLVAIVVVTDENEEVADPLAIGGQGWAFENSQFPGPTLGSPAPEGTIECKNKVDTNNPTASGPYDPKCTSCAFVKGDPNFATRCPNVGNGKNGFLDPNDDKLNVRFFNQKQRFGVFVGYPTSRYVLGLTKPAVPDRDHEHDKYGNYIGNSQANCVNPLFATQLPTTSNGTDLCALQRGPRTADLIYYAAIAGVPHELLQVNPRDAHNSAQKDELSDADWQLIIGKDPEHYDFTGADFHMIESYLPRTGQNLPPGVVNSSQCPPGSSDTCDPINGREWDTQKGDLEYACTFDLPVPKDCTQSDFNMACDCQSAGAASQSPNSQTPLCLQSGGSYTTMQIKGKAYPSVREMIIARAMKKQGIVSSLCPIHVQKANNDVPPDPLFGYRPAINTIVNRLKVSLSTQCLNRKLVADSQGDVPCLILVTLPGEGSCLNPTCDPTQALVTPPSSILPKFCQTQEDAWNQGGGQNSGVPEPLHRSVCQLKQLTPARNPTAFDQTGSCASPPDGMSLGWCYVEGAPGCAQQILFTNNEPPHGSTANLQCIEQAGSVVGGDSPSASTPVDDGGTPPAGE
jgi:hypothetical protein